MKKICLMICLVFMLASNVSAAKIKLVNDGYQTKQNWKVKRIIVDGKLTYCLEPGLDVAFKNYKKSDFKKKYSKISLAKKKKIDKIGVVGEYYYKKNNNNVAYYYAAQELIWQQASKIKVTFKKDLSSYKKKINEIVNDFDKVPTFKNKQYDIKAGTSKEYVDTQLKYSRLDNKADFENKTGLKVNLKNNKLTITNPLNNKKVSNAKLNFTKFYNYFSKGTSLAYSNNIYQDFVMTKMDSNIKFSASFKGLKAYGKFSGIKSDEKNNKLKGAIFAYYLNGIKKGEVVSDEQGKFISNDLELEKYTIKETKAPNDYNIDTKVYEVQIIANKTVVINEGKNIVNKHQQGDFQLTKLGEQIKDNRPLQGVVFGVYKNNNLITKLTSDKNGNAKSILLDTGYYQVKELSTDNQFILDDKVYNIQIKDNETGYLNNNKPLINKQKRGSFNFKKKGENNKLLQGVVFELSNDINNDVIRVTSNKDGVVEVKDLFFGTYYLKEVSTLNDYVLNVEPIVINIKDDKQLLLKDFINKLKRYEILLEKRDLDNNELLDGVEFSVTKDKIQYGVYKTVNGKLVINNLLKGCYDIKETKQLTGYIKNKETYNVCVGTKQVNKLIVYNKKNTSTTDSVLEIRKLDKQSSSSLANATFEIENENSKKKLEKTTNKNGIILLKLAKGCYNIVETKAPLGYKKDNNVERLCLKENERKEKVFFNNKLLNVKVGLKKESMIPIFIVLIATLGFKVLSMLFRNRL